MLLKNKFSDNRKQFHTSLSPSLRESSLKGYMTGEAAENKVACLVRAPAHTPRSGHCFHVLVCCHVNALVRKPLQVSLTCACDAEVKRSEFETSH